MPEKTVNIIDQIFALNDPKKIVAELTKEDEYIKEAEINQDEYDGKHKILLKDNKKIGEDTTAKTIPVSRLVTTFQKLITNLAVAFLFGRPVKYVLDSEDNTQDAFTSMEDLFRQKKMQYFDRKLARTTMIETRSAEWWVATNDSFDPANPKTPDDPEYIASKINVILLSIKTGYKIYPYFDQFSNLIAFTMTYSGKAYDEKSKKVVSRDYVKILTNTKFITYVKSGSGFVAEDDSVNPFGKIPIIYYAQEKSEWKDVQSLIERYEDHISKHADENDYYGSPMMKVKGKMIKPPDKTQSGKVLQFESQVTNDGKDVIYGDAEYLTWDREPESITFEGNNLKDLIYTLTSTPDISFSSVKGISSLSGIALKLLFFDATLKSMNHQGVFGEGLARRVNLVRQMLSVTNVSLAAATQEMEVTVKFQDPTPQDIKETIETLTDGLAGEPVMSRKTALRNNPLVSDVKEEELEMDVDEKRSTESEELEAGSLIL